MRYALLLHGPESEGETPSQLSKEVSRQWQAFFEQPDVAQAVVVRVPLRPTTEARTVRVQDGRRMVTDGPFAETKEQLGGLVVVDVADLEAAVGIAGRAPCLAAGSVEVRPVLEPT